MVFIAIACLSAALPGTIAAHTTRPVVGVPVSGKVNLDAILSVTQMPPGVPVAAVGLDRGENAALLAVQILALGDEGLEKKLREHREAMKRWVLEDSKSLGEERVRREGVYRGAGRRDPGRRRGRAGAHRVLR